MMRMTRLTDYGIVLLTHIARHPERITRNARDLAAEARLPLPTVSKVLKILVRNGLLAAQRGVNGGFRLARLPEKITMDEIITALEGPVALTECNGRHPGRCELELLCPVGSNWQRMNRAVRDTLGKITLSDMTKPIPQTLAAPHRQSNRAEV